MSWEDAVVRALPAGAVPLSTDSVVLDPDPRQVAVARRFVTDHAPELPEATSHALVLLTSELVSNAVIHARTEIEVAVTVTETDVVITVHDQDLGRREQNTHERNGGRGLVIVEALAEDSGQLRHPEGGKTSWFRLSRCDDQAAIHSLT